MTQKNLTYQVVLSSLVLLMMAGCDGGQQSGVMRGQNLNANVAPAPQGSVIRTGRAERGAFFSFQTNPQEALQCQHLCTNGQCTPRCQRVFHHYMSRGFGPNYFQNQQQFNLFGSLGGGNQGNGYVFDYNQFHMADVQWQGNYNQNLGQYHTLNNMNEFCQTPSNYLHESVNFGNCNNIDMNYLIGSAQANNAFNYYVNGKPHLAQTAIENSKKACPKCRIFTYGTYWGKRNVAEENKVIMQDFKRTWENMLNLPENIALRLGNGILNVAMTRAMIPVAQIDARLAAMNYNAAQQLNYYEQMAALAWNAATIPVYMTGGTCDAAYQQAAQDNGAQEGGQGGFVVGEVDPTTDGYIISCGANDG